MINPFIPLIQSYLPEPEASLLSGMLFGKSAAFPKNFYNALIATGTIHVVALSGMNLTILVNFLSKVAYPLGRKISGLAGIAGIIGFIFFVGPSPTIVRAGIMAVISLCAILIGRQTSILLSLFVAGLIMILFNPSIISNISFQLSFLATLGILVFAAEPIKTTKFTNNISKDIFIETKNIFRENLRTTLAAQVATLPIIVFTFARISLVSPLTNLLIGWVVSPVTILGIILCFLGLIYYPIGQIISWFVYLPLHYFVKVVEITSKIPFANLQLN